MEVLTGTFTSSAGSTLIEVRDVSVVGEARRMANHMAASAGLDETLRGRVAIIVTECGNNLLRHAGGGDIILRPIPEEGGGLEILALDRGPGIPDLAGAMRDGFSTIGTPGNGMGAMQRLSTHFDVYTQPNKGTIVLARVLAGEAAPSAWDLGIVSVPTRGETVCGDAWGIMPDGESLRVMVADGLGHGPLARVAADGAIDAFTNHIGQPAEEVLKLAHAALRPTRGAAASIALLAPDGVRYCGVGNVAGVVCSDGATQSLVSTNGTLGHQLHRLHAFQYPWPERALLVMHSDGLTSHWKFDGYPGLTHRHPALVAAALFRDHCRGRDDTTVVVIRRRRV